MPDLLLELFSEEIPARMQARAAEDLRKMVTDRLVDAGLVYDGARAFATPRRLALTVRGVPARQPDLKDEKKGPRVGAPPGAIAGFLKSAGLNSIDEAKIEKDPRKGDFYVALIDKPGRDAIDVLADMLPVIVRTFPWPKAMRWGERSEKPGALNWVRPLHSIVATFGADSEEPQLVHFSVDGVEAGMVTYGHRFLAPDPISVRRFDDYVGKLEKAKVVLDPERRKDIIRADAKNLAFAQGLEVVEDDGLLAEVAGLVEWPVVLMGSFDEAFLRMPPEVIRATIRNNQKCFVLRDPAHATLVNKFILVANIEARDGGKAIVAGNERVIRARLSDAKFFYDTDLKTRLEDRLPRFKDIVFHEKLGTQAERIARIMSLARVIGELIEPQLRVGELRYGGSSATYHNNVQRAAQLCKADLLTEMVGEFPELQGLVGKYYAQEQGEDEAVAHACEDHYKPQGPNDLVPADPVSIAVALADKIDTLVGFWAIDEKPTGSKDPYALRRAALGVIRLVLSSEIRFHLTPIFWFAYRSLTEAFIAKGFPHVLLINENGKFVLQPRATEGGLPERDDIPVFDIDELRESHSIYLRATSLVRSVVILDNDPRKTFYDFELFPYNGVQASLLSFFADRLKVQLREQGARHDLVDAVFALGTSSTSPWRGEVARRSPQGEGVAGGGEQKSHPTPPLRGDPPPPGEGEASATAAPQDDLLLIVRRVEALGKFLDTDDGKNLLAGFKRAANILRIEEKKDNTAYDGAPDATLYKQDEEKALARAIDSAKAEASAAVGREDFAAAMTAMARLRPHVDAFFDKVTVNVEDKALRANRLKLLNEIRAATRAVADFSRIEG